MAAEAWILYGANGYTGSLIAREAAARGMRPILAGRSREKLEPLARELKLECRAFPLDEPSKIALHLQGVRTVLNCAGPFSKTAVPLIEACLSWGANYLDITGEIDAIEAAAARSQRAVQSRMALLPSVGFDVVPSDCLAAELADRLPGATHLQLAFGGLDKVSPGTLKTMIESLPQGGKARINGRIETVPIAWKVMEVPFPTGPRWAMTIPWGDVASAYYSTGIPNIEVYAATPERQIRLVRRFRFLVKALKLPPVRALVRWRIEKTVHGPSEEERANARAVLWGRVTNAAGQTAEASLSTPDGYQLTVLTSLAAVERVLDGSVPRGFHTPSKAFGKDFIRTIPGVK